MSYDYDAIVIGSGLGGLATAALLSKIDGKRVLVLERHWVAGGFTHTFKRPGGYRWDVGVHYVGSMAEGGAERQLFDFISDGKLGWTPMVEPFEKFVYPDFTFEVYGERERFRADLIERFPRERRGIDRYLSDVEKGLRFMGVRGVARSARWPLRTSLELATVPYRNLSLQTTAAYLARQIADPKLRALLVSQWGAYGLPPSKSAFGLHALLTRHYMNGGYYPTGGSRQLAATIIPVIEAGGGEVVTSTEATEIVVHRGRAVAVATKNSRGEVETYRAPVIVSGVGAYNTYGKLLRPGAHSTNLAPLLDLAQQAPTTMVAYIGFRDDPRKLGFAGENHWISESYDHEHHATGAGLGEGRAEWCYLSFPSLKSGQEETVHTAEIMAFVGRESFERWSDSRWMKRGGDYGELKESIADGLLSLVERHYPGFRAMVDHVEVSSPLSVEHFTSSPFGAVYGLPATPERFREPLCSARTSIDNLFLTGSDAFMYGVLGAALSGAVTTGAVRGGMGFLGVMQEVTGARSWRRAVGL